MTWVMTELRGSVHVHPFYEEGHILGPWCWCEPERDEEEGRPLVSHRDHLWRVVGEERS